MESLASFIRAIQQQIAQGDLELALEQLQNYLADRNSTLYKEALLHFAEYNRLRREVRKGLLTREEARVMQADLENRVLNFVDIVSREANTQKLPPILPMPSLTKVSLPDEVRLEKILGINNLKQIVWIERGMQVAKSVCRILTPNGFGTGFLIGPNRLMTNHHVIPSMRVALKSHAEFNYQLDLNGGFALARRYRFDQDPNRFHTNVELDYTIASLDAEPRDQETWGYLTLNPDADPVPGEHVSIIQHPNGGPKQIALTANQVVSLWQHRLQYTTDTMPGSSGSPVFNDMWQVIAIHHAGGDLQMNARGDKRFINEGILLSAIKSNAGNLWPLTENE